MYNLPRKHHQKNYVEKSVKIAKRSTEYIYVMNHIF